MNEHDILNEALRRTSPEGRARYLDEVCGSDGELRRRVEELLDAEARVNADQEPVPAAGRPAFATTLIAAQEEGPGAQIGPYKLLQQIGEGGMGVVYLAEQVEPVVRRVALKIIKPGIDTRQVIARFEAERQALALMDHACIAKVFDAGATAGGRPYFVMELVKGIPITRFCDQQQLSVEKRLQLFLQVCQAVQHAHQKGVIHRDLKPSNVLVALSDGVPIPKVIDFGLAKATSQRLTEKTLFTEYGQVVGTLEYMSPEQADLNQLDIDTRTDIYSLGALLYELLTGSTPLERSRLRSAAFHEMLKMIREEEPQRPSTRLSTLQIADLSAVSQQRAVDPKKLPALFRGELDWVVMKALDKNRSRRYETANGFARDIQRFLSNQPVEMRPPSSMYRFRKFASRHKAGMAAGVAGALVLIAAIAGLVISNRLITSERDEKDQALLESQRHEADAIKSAKAADEQRANAQQQRDEKAQQLYIAQIQVAKQEWEEKHAARARQILETYLPENNGGVDLRGWEWHYLWRLTHGELRAIQQPTAAISIAFTPDGKSLVTGHDGMIRVWNADGTKLLRSWMAHPNEARPDRARVQKMVISSDGTVMATVGIGKDVKLWEIATGNLIRSFPSRQSLWSGLAMSPDHTRIAAPFEDGEIIIYDVATGTEVRRLKGESLQLAISADGRRLASVGGPTPGGIRVQHWNLETGEELKNITTNNLSQTAVAISPDGRTIVSGDVTGAVIFWDADSGAQLRWTQAHDGQVERVVFNSDGSRLASASSDSTICVWDSKTREIVQTFRGHDECLDVAFVSNGDVIASCGWDNVVRLWDTAIPEQPFQRGDYWYLNRVAYSPDGRFYAVSDDANITVYDAASYIKLYTANSLMRVAGEILTSPWDFDAKNRWIVLGDSTADGGFIQFRDVQTGNRVLTTRAHSQPLLALACFPDGRIATGSADGEIAIWNADGVHETVRFHAHNGPVAALAVSHDNKLIASGSPDPNPVIHLWNTDDGGHLKKLGDVPGTVYSLVFSRDGKFLFSGDRSGNLRSWDVALGKEVRRRSGPSQSLAISPDGKRIASCGGDQTVKISDANLDSELLTLKCKSGRRRSPAFSPDGWKLAVGGGLGGDLIWDAQPLTPEHRVEVTARKLIADLLAKGRSKEFVLESLKSIPTISEEVREQALTFAGKISEQDESSESFNNLAWGIASRPGRSTDDYNRAVGFARRAVAAVPDESNNQNTLGVALYRVGDWCAAETAIRKSMELDGGGSAFDWLFLAMIEWQQGRKEQAQKWYEAGSRWRAIYSEGASNDELDAFCIEAAALLGIKYDGAAKNHDKQSLLDALFAAGGNETRYWTWYEWRMEMHIAAGRWADAKPDALRVGQLRSEDDFTQYTIAALLAAQGTWMPTGNIVKSCSIGIRTPMSQCGPNERPRRASFSPQPERYWTARASWQTGR